MDRLHIPGSGTVSCAHSLCFPPVVREALYVQRDGVSKVVTLNLDKRSYAKFTTKPKDKVRREKLVQKYGRTEGIERFANGEGL